MTFVNRVMAVIGAAAIVTVVTLAANTPLRLHDPDRAVLRLAWSAWPERIENCRQQTAEELDRLPAHMRQPVTCEGTTARYRLAVFVNGAAVVDRVVRAGGLRHDRRLYVVEEAALTPGETDVEVRFDREDAGAPAPVPPGRTSPRPLTDAVPARLHFRERFRVAPRQVVLVTYAPERHALISRQGSPSAVR